MKSIPYVVMLCVVVAALCFAQNKTSTKSAQLSASAVIERVRPSVVQVMAQAAEGPSGGSGFVVANNYVITNCHVVGLCRVNPILTNPSVMVGFRIPNISTAHVQMKESFQFTAAQIIDTDLANDLTLLKLPNGGGMRPVFGVSGGGIQEMVQIQFVSVKISDAVLSDGTELFISGFPLHEPSLVTQRGMIASAVMREDVFGDQEDRHNQSDVILLDGMVNHGNSGGPVYLATTGEVVGVAEAFVGAEDIVVPAPEQPAPPNSPPLQPVQPPRVYGNSGLAVVIPAKYVTELLVKNHVVGATPTK